METLGMLLQILLVMMVFVICGLFIYGIIYTLFVDREITPGKLEKEDERREYVRNRGKYCRNECKILASGHCCLLFSYDEPCMNYPPDKKKYGKSYDKSLRYICAKYKP